MPRKTSSEPGWDEIGKMVGKKMEKMNDKECCGGWHKYMFKRHHTDGGFFGRLLFAIGMLILLTTMGVIHGVATWVLVLIGAGFALMKF